MRRLLSAAGLVLVAGTLTACGGPPDDASKSDFCKSIAAAPSEDKPSQDDVDEWVDELKDTGTPKDIDDDERNGYEVLVDALDDADVDDLGDDSGFEDLVDDGDDRKDVEKFLDYYAEACAG
jgi:hypothetical protein